VRAPRTQRAFLIALGAVLVAVGLAYAPGLSGGFLFDDFVNLRTLGAYGPVDDAHTLLLYLTSGIADPTGRPVALASFLIDARDWPADPFSFKRSNVLLHLLNGALLIGLVLRLERRLRGSPCVARGLSGPLRHGAAPPVLVDDPSRGIALLAGLLWMAHPLFVSTTLYVVQRHAMLAFTFVLLAFLCWDAAYTRLREGRWWSGMAWAVLGVGGCTLLAGLSKANGFLAPLLVLMALLTVYRADLSGLVAETRRRIRWVAALILGIPASAVVIYLLRRIPGRLDVSGVRDFTLAERLLTQPRALSDYLWSLLVPRAGGGGVFVEDFSASQGLLDPWTTLPSMLLVLGLVIAAIWFARRMPVMSFAILFYFAAHLMESTVIMLELYFEHRNYLPAAFLAWPLARWLVLGRILSRLRLALAVVLPLVLLLLTFQRATVWGDPALLAALSSHHSPASARAQMVAATEIRQAGDPEAAADQVRRALELHPGSVELALNLIGHECQAGAVSAEALAAARHALSLNRVWHQGIIRWLKQAMASRVRQGCAGLELEDIAGLLAAMGSNPSAVTASPRRQNYVHLKAHLALQMGNPEEALALFNEALEIRANPDFALSQAADLGNAGYPAWGVRHLDYFLALPEPPLRRIRDMRSLHERLLHRTGYFKREVELLRKSLDEGVATP
jgi:protein O-mannosyl-transferase